MHVLPALFAYVKANEVCGPSPLTAVPTRDWTAAQYEEIQLLATSVLCTLAPLMTDDYIASHGGTRLLLMLEWCISSGTAVANAVGKHGKMYYAELQVQICPMFCII